MTTRHVLHTARLNNNCPECYDTDGLEFTFTQEEKHTKLYTQANKEIDEKLYCHTCKNTIYPVNWDEDIERVYQYHKKQAHPNTTYLKLKPLTYGLILFGIVIIGAATFLLLNQA
ncbi:hypothetical protein [Marixanthomonas ophiurae]|uniref:Uncharacterized protein n=1 Tax=Marixanthomonas ophiurae TaxID=387659 RepID=A0A3E1QB71_9FLAO|nr:hypothetical protein [Marixanthomonas ophiurae]RFN59373.1 hypothetical protein DZ858_04710 [Marixanthomonas ophiurae]